MSRRFRIFSLIVALGHLFVASVFATAHDAMIGPVWYWVFKWIPWECWATVFYVTGIAMAFAIGRGNPRAVRASASVGVVALYVWAADFALIIPSVLAGNLLSWMGVVLVTLIASLELTYLALPASTYLDLLDDEIAHEYAIAK